MGDVKIVSNYVLTKCLLQRVINHKDRVADTTLKWTSSIMGQIEIMTGYNEKNPAPLLWYSCQRHINGI